MKFADLDLHCFPKSVDNFEKVMHRGVLCLFSRMQYLLITPKLDTTPPKLDTNPPTCKLDTNQYYIYHKIVYILTFISMINTTCESLRARIIYIFPHFSFMSS